MHQYELGKGQVKKILLLYSGGLKSSIAIPWIKKNYKVEIITLLVDIGQPQNLEKLRQQALSLGAKEVIIYDAKELFINEYVIPAIKANATYQNKFHLTIPLNRPLLAKIAIEIAEEKAIGCIAHASNLHSNDQVRLERILLSLSPDIKILAPVRQWKMNREQQVAFAKTHNILPTKQHAYTHDVNLWGSVVIGGNLDDVTQAPDFTEIVSITTPITQTPNTPETVTISFAQGVPTALNNKPMQPIEIVNILTTKGGQHGIGLTQSIEDSILGLKIRNVYESPAATILIEAHKALEHFVSTREENNFKTFIDQKWAYLCYDCLWLEPLMENLNAYINHANQKVTGLVTLTLFKGTAAVVATAPQKGIFYERSSTFTAPAGVDPQAIPGFIQLSALPMMLSQRKKTIAYLSIGTRTNKYKLLPYIKKLDQLHYTFYATYKTHKFLKKNGISSIFVNKIYQPLAKPNVIDLLKNNRFDIILDIPTFKKAKITEKERDNVQYMKRMATDNNVPFLSTVEEAQEFIDNLQNSYLP